MFKVFAATPENMGPGQIGAHAARAEAMGFDGLQVPDAIRRPAAGGARPQCHGQAPGRHRCAGGFSPQPDDRCRRQLGFTAHVWRPLQVGLGTLDQTEY